MNSYISRQSAYETLSEYYHQRTEIQHIALAEALNRVPDVDVRENVHGEWVYNSEEYPMGNPHYECSVCGESVFDKTNFCPNCGANMRGDINE